MKRLELRGDERVLDAGCGSGRVTKVLGERLPRGEVIAVDASVEMVAKARRVLGPEADVRVVELTALELEKPVDAIFSNAVFHWLPDHDALFAALRGAMRPGGRLVAQCGGEGNVAGLGAAIRNVAEAPPYREHLEGLPSIWNFASAEDSRRRLEAAGFVEVRCWLEPKEVRPEQPLEFLRTVSLGPHIARLPETLRDPFVTGVQARMEEPLVLRYVRLNIEARVPGT